MPLDQVMAPWISSRNFVVKIYSHTVRAWVNLPVQKQSQYSSKINAKYEPISMKSIMTTHSWPDTSFS